MRRFSPVFICWCILWFLLSGCSGNQGRWVTVYNMSTLDREDEVVEISLQTADRDVKEPFVVKDEEGREIPSQLTHDGKIIFPVSLKAKAKAAYQIVNGIPAAYEPIAQGRQYPERLDDMAWENDRIAFRAYGPALQASGERAFGYDILVKRVDKPVLENRYALNKKNVSYHVDHGDGLDYYSVGPTLGGGASALLEGDSILFPYCYSSFEVLDNGPLRFTVSLTYPPRVIGSDSAVVEKRLVTLDAGSQLNKVVVSYEGLTEARKIGTGIVLHQPSELCLVDEPEGIMGYADPEDDVNGRTFIGVVFPGSIETIGIRSGHLMGVRTYEPAMESTYYFGAGWSKWGFLTMDDWSLYLRQFSRKLADPLLVMIESS